MDQEYPDKNVVNIIEIADEAEGGLIISDFPNLGEIKKKTEGEKNITELTINNCGNLQRINVYFCRKIKELIITGCPLISEINCDTNLIENLELGELSGLTRLNCSSNQLTNLDVHNNHQLSHLACEKNKIKELDLNNNSALTFLDMNDNPLIHAPYFFSKKQRNKMKKMRENLTASEQIVAVTLEENEEKIESLETRVGDLKFSLAQEQKILAREQKENQELRQDLFTLQEKIRLDEKEKMRLIKQNQEVKRQLLHKEVQIKQAELELSLGIIKSKLDEDTSEELDTLLEAQEELIKDNNSYIQKQLEKIKKRLLSNEKVKEQELARILRFKTELTNFQKELAKLEIELETQIEILPD